MADNVDNSDFIFDGWLKLLQQFRDDIEADLETVRLHKKEIQEIKQEIYNRLDSGYYLRDDKRLVISAPEIVIGNVDKRGQLLDGTSTIIIRSNGVDIQGAGTDGYIRSKATSIQQQAIDPGCDGCEEVVHPHANVKTQARAILMDSNSSEDVYVRNIDAIPALGITIHSDRELIINASKSRTDFSECIDDKISLLEADSSKLKEEATEQFNKVTSIIKDLKTKLKEDAKYVKSNEVTSTSIVALDALRLYLADKSSEFFRSIDNFVNAASQCAEKCRQQKALKANKTTLSADEFKKEATGARVTINAEQIEFTNRDGDNWIRENDDAFLRMSSKNIFIGSVNANEENLEKGKITLRGDSILVETNDKKRNDDNIDMPTTGKVEINSKEILVSSLDYEQKKDQERTEKNLTENGGIRIRAKKINVDGTDLEGKAAGELTMNSGKISLVSAEVDKESREIKEIHKGGILELATETVTIGKDTAEKILSEKIEAKAKTDLKLIQGDKATLSVSDNSLTVETDGTNFSKGALKVNVESEFNKKITGTSIEAKELVAKEVTGENQLKSRNFSVN